MTDRLRFGYGTNGFSNHRLDDCLVILADLGYQGVALTLDPCHLDPAARDLGQQVDRLRRRLAELGLAVVIETGGRFVLDRWRKHEPTLISDPHDAQPRVQLLLTAVRIAADLGAEAVSFWSGAAAPDVAPAVAWDRLTASSAVIVEAATKADVVLGFEPEPGMFIDTIGVWSTLADRLGRPGCFGLTLDIGHCRCNEPEPPDACVRHSGQHLVNVQIDDMRQGVHEHLPFGEGEIDFPPVLRALSRASYGGLVSVELPRHSHAAPSLAAQSIDFLRLALADRAVEQASR
jgi:L-ribulose-5-phosphate 3-epimerase